MEKIKLNIQMFAGATIDGYSTASNCDCQIVWSSTLDLDKNTSSVTASIQIRKNGSGSTQGTFSGNITIDGTSQGVSKYGSWSWGTWHTVGSYTKTVTHNDNGQKSITISGSLTQTGTSMAGTYSASGTATLDTNNRASVLGDIDNFGINDTVDIPITKYVAGYTDSLVISSGATTIKTINSITNGYDLTFTTGEKNTILGLMTSPQISLTFTLTTKDGATQIGSSSVKYVTVTSLDKPVLYNINKKTNGYYQLAINGIVDDNGGTVQAYDDSGNQCVFSEYVLYDNGTTGTNGTVTLSETAANFTYLEIFYREASTPQVFSSLRTYSPNGKSFGLTTIVSDSTGLYFKSKKIAISGTSITVTSNSVLDFYSNNTHAYGTGNVIYITRVIGYR